MIRSVGEPLPVGRVGAALVGILALWVLLGLGVAAQAADQCVACHTDPAKLKALIQPPAEIVEEEGEG